MTMAVMQAVFEGQKRVIDAVPSLRSKKAPTRPLQLSVPRRSQALELIGEMEMPVLDIGDVRIEKLLPLRAQVRIGVARPRAWREKKKNNAPIKMTPGDALILMTAERTYPRYSQVNQSKLSLTTVR